MPMTEGDDPWTLFQISLLMAATMLAVVCTVCLILTALKPYIVAQVPVEELVPRMTAAN